MWSGEWRVWLVQGAEGCQGSSGGDEWPPRLGRRGHITPRSLVWSAWSTAVEGDVTRVFFLPPSRPMMP